jgi:acyl-CoA thioester hydrolase
LNSATQPGETFRLPVRVYYEDTDAAGVVYYANYLKFMERARTEWLSSLGFAVDAVERDEGVLFVVHRVEIDFHLPARLGERLDATVSLTALGRARLVVAQDVRRDDALLTHAQVTLACLDRTRFRPARIPHRIHDRMERVA